MEGGVKRLGQDQGSRREAGGERQRHEDQSHALGGCGLPARNRRIQDPKLLPLLALLHALGDLGFFVPLRQGLIQLAGTFIVAGEFFELLLPARHVFDPRLVGRDGLPEALFLSLENLALGFRLSEAFLQPQHRRGGRRGLWGRRLCFSAGIRGLGLHGLALEGGDLCTQPDHVRVLLAELGAKGRQLPPQPGEPGLRRLG